MNVETMNIKTVKPYERNAKKHPQDQVEKIANSLKEFGWQQPLVVDQNNVLVIGHGRLLAAKLLGMHEVPVVRVNNLTEAQIKALRLADNRVSESDWDDDLLNLELDSLNLDMTDFGFLDEEEEDEDDRAPSVRHDVFENQEKMQFPGDGFYQIPIMEATQTVGDKMLRFCDHNQTARKEDYIAHFYYDDYKFMAAWRDPDRFVSKLRKFKAVVSPNFSLYTDFPRALQILSCYRRNWCGAYWQYLGIDVIPNVVWGEKESYQFCFDGIPKHSTVSVSTVGIKNDNDWNNREGDLFRAGYNEMMKRLEPTTVLFYGDMISGCEGNIIRCPSFYEQRRAMLNEMKKEKKRKMDQEDE